MKQIFSRAIKASFWTRFNFCLGAILIVASFIIPPEGVIDPSVLAAVGELSIAAALISLFDKIHDQQTHEFNIKWKEIELNLKKDKGNEE